MRGSSGSCIEARALIIALPEEYQYLKPDKILKDFTDFFKEKYGVECISALHHNKRQTNYHIHMVFAERKELEKPEVKIATRNRFYDEEGRHRRTRKEILDKDGNVRKGCYIIRKGEVYSGHYFEPKNPYFKSKAFLRDLKELYTELINQQIGKEERRLKVYSKDSIYLPTKKIGKNNPNENYILKNNEAVCRWNYCASMAASIMSEDHVKEVRNREILEPVKAAVKENKDQTSYPGIVKAATKVLNRLAKEWLRLPSLNRPDAGSDMFSRMIKYCRERVLKTKERER